MNVTLDYGGMICGECHIRFYVDSVFVDTCVREHRSWWCPNGHKQHYTGEREADILRRERDRLKQENARLEEQRLADAREVVKAQREAKKAKTEAKRVAKRTHAGVCTCCNRSFANVARHMKTKHPEIIDLEAARK